MQQLGINGLSFTIVSDIIIVKDATEAPLLQAAFYNFFKNKKCLACSWHVVYARSLAMTYGTSLSVTQWTVIFLVFVCTGRWLSGGFE